MPAPVYPADYLAAAALPYGSPDPATGRTRRPGTRSCTADSPAAPAYGPRRPAPAPARAEFLALLEEAPAR